MLYHFARAPIVRLEVVSSTNNYAASMVHMTSPSEGTAIVAQYQEDGRGQRGNPWQSDPGCNLLVSIILYPAFLNLSMQFDLSRCVALATADACENCCPGLSVAIKWPNDLYCQKRKLGGILIETEIRGQSMDAAIAGIGINVNQEHFEGINGTSLLILTGQRHVPEYLLDLLRTHLGRWYGLLSARKYEAIRAAYEEKLYGKNALYRYEVKGRVFRARVSGTQEDGGLMLESGEGLLGPFSPREVKLLQEE